MNNIEKLYAVFRSTSGVITDTRKIKPDCLFVALKGSNFNGNKFASVALEKGAKYAIVDEVEYAIDERCFLVENGLDFLQKLANHHRKQFNIPVIAITGSNGKTTTKELSASVLSSTYPTHFTQGNLNNHIGVPLTLLAMPDETEVAIIEMGANHQKEIAALCEIAAPTHGLVTNIGKAHLEGFGGIEGVKKGKGELFDYLAEHNGVAFINTDEKFLGELSSKVKHQVDYFRSDQPSMDVKGYEIKVIETKPYVKVGFINAEEELFTLSTQLVGEYNVNNVMTAISLGKYFKVPAKSTKAAIEGYIPSNNRSEIRKIDSNTFYLDAYNANPTSTAAALSHFNKIEAGDKIVVLGDMLELGDYSNEEHRKVVDLLAKMNLKYVCLVGKEYGEVINENDSVAHFDNVTDLKDWFGRTKIENATILLKGSRGIGLERVLV